VDLGFDPTRSLNMIAIPFCFRQGPFHLANLRISAIHSRSCQDAGRQHLVVRWSLSGLHMGARANTVVPDAIMVRRKRHEAGLTQGALAGKAGVHKSIVERIERGKPVYVETLGFIAEALDVGLGDLLLATEGEQGRKSQPELDFDAIEQCLRDNLRAQAVSHLTEKLHGRAQSDYQLPELEIGHVGGSGGTSPQMMPAQEDQGPSDHNRVWTNFDWTHLLDPKGVYILSSDPGTGKTAFLRYLQLQIIEQGQSIPILVRASQIRNARFDNTDDFITCIASRLRTGIPKTELEAFLRKYPDKLVVLVDGLDQIAGAGRDFQDLLRALFTAFDGRLIVASRPFGVVSQELNDRVEFLRLEPFSSRMQQMYLRYNRKLWME
jgi:transcriptional regulator with XRE-family HTH domain